MPSTVKSPPLMMTQWGYLGLFFGERRVQLYLFVALALSLATVLVFPGNSGILVGIGVTLLAEPFVEYAIHRFVFHGRLYRVQRLAVFWKYIHYDHHMDPNDPRMIFGPAQILLPLAFVITLPLGLLAGGWAGAAGALCAGLWVIVAYEYLHGAAHFLASPPTPHGRWMKRMHVLHHFHNEHGNYGVITPLCDMLFGTYYASAGAMERSPTVRNLGYTDAEAETYPWVKLKGERDARLASAHGPEGMAG